MPKGKGIRRTRNPSTGGQLWPESYLRIINQQLISEKSSLSTKMALIASGPQGSFSKGVSISLLTVTEVLP